MNNYVYFYREREKNGFLSNWYKAGMFIDGMKFSCVEQYMMYRKAVLFGDYEVAGHIMASTNQGDMKKWGRKVRDFDEQIWCKYRYDIVKRGVIAKFMCNEDLMQEFLKFPYGSIFVECSPWDTIWGIGLGIGDSRIYDENQWQGMNLLGKVLTEIRVEVEGW